MKDLGALTELPSHDLHLQAGQEHKGKFVKANVMPIKKHIQTGNCLFYIYMYMEN